MYRKLTEFHLVLYGLHFDVRMFATTYEDGNLAIILETVEGEPFAKLTVNVPDVQKDLGADEFIVKGWSENAELLGYCFRTGLFEDTLKRAKLGFVLAPIWRWSPAGLLALAQGEEESVSQ